MKKENQYFFKGNLEYFGIILCCYSRKKKILLNNNIIYLTTAYLY